MHRNFIAIFSILVMLLVLLFGTSILRPKTYRKSFGVWKKLKSAQQYRPASYKSLDQSDEDLIAYTRRSILEPPDTKPYNLTPSGEREDVQQFQAKQDAGPILKELFKNKVGGVFFEAGAYDGYYLSTTLTLETEYNWTGLMVEGNPENIERYRLRHRKAWFAPVLISTKTHPTQVQAALVNYMTYVQPKGDVVRTFKCGKVFRVGHNDEDLKKLMKRSDCVPYDNRRIQQAIPLYTLLKASGFTEIDFFSLDVEGAEVDILRTIPFDKITIKVFLIEVRHSDKNEIIAIMKENNYEVIRKINNLDIFKIRFDDLLFVKKGILKDVTYTTA